MLDADQLSGEKDSSLTMIDLLSLSGMKIERVAYIDFFFSRYFLFTMSAAYDCCCHFIV